MKCAKQKNHVLFPQLLLRKKAAEELKKEQERKAAERRKVKRRLFDYIVSQFSIVIQCVFISGWMYFLARWSTSGVVSRRTWRAPAKVNILLTKQWRAVTLPLGLLSTSLLPPKTHPTHPISRIIAFPLTLPSSFYVQHHRLCHSLQLYFSKFANSSTFITLNRRLGMQTRWCKFAKSIIQKSTNWRGTSGTWRGALRSGYWRYTPEWSQPWHFSIVSKLRSGSNLETHHGSQGVGAGRKRAHLGL